MSKSAIQFDSGLNQSFLNVSSSGAEAKPSPQEQNMIINYDNLKFGSSIGKGAYGEVFVGDYLEEKIAIKVYDFRGELSAKEQQEILNEAKLMESLRSQYLVGFRGICWDRRYCLVMEYCQGGTLRARLDKGDSPVSPLEQLRWAQQISYGVNSLHKANILHRDLKGENILLDKNSNAKVGDFGLSVVKSSSASQSKAGAGLQLAGTLPWMAPELFSGRAHQTGSDIYSIGMILWEIASRKLPFAGKMPPVIIGMVLSGKRELIDNQWPLVFQKLIQACWNIDPLKRPNAEKIGDEFGAALKALSAIDKPISQAPPSAGIAAESKIQPISQNAQSLLPAPKAVLTPAELIKLQDELVIACEQGELKQVLSLLIRGANALTADSKGKKPLAAAVWGMNPEVVNSILQQAGGVSTMTWDECEKHNLAHYKEVFALSQFVPERFGEWHSALQKIQQSSFLKENHLKDAQQSWPGALANWVELTNYLKGWHEKERMGPSLRKVIEKSKSKFSSYQAQIKEMIQTKPQLKPGGF